MFIIVLCFLYFIFCIVEILRVSKKRQEPIEEVEFDESVLKNQIIFLSLQGKNTFDNPWYLDLDIPKEFVSFLSTRDYFTLSRVKKIIIFLGSE